MNHPADIQYFKDLDREEMDELELEAMTEAVENDIQLNRGTTAIDVVGYIDPDEIEYLLVVMTETIFEKTPVQLSHNEKILKKFLDKAIVAYARQRLVNLSQQEDYRDE